METDLNIDEYVISCPPFGQHIPHVGLTNYVTDSDTIPDEGTTKSIKSSGHQTSPCFSSLDFKGINKLNSLVVTASHSISYNPPQNSSTSPALKRILSSQRVGYSSINKRPLTKLTHINNNSPNTNCATNNVRHSMNNISVFPNTRKETQKPLLQLFQTKIQLRIGAVFHSWESRNATLQEHVLRIYPLVSDIPEIIINFNVIHVSIHTYNRTIT
jgi:hypothetical protein